MPRQLKSLAVLALSTAGFAAGGYESPPTFKASELLPQNLRKGAHFAVGESVPTVGYFYLFKITSDFGNMEAEGRSLLETRLSEVDALARLDETSKTDVFLSAAGNSVLKVGKGVANVVVDPGGTAKGIGAGVKRFGNNLGRKTKRAADDVTHEDKESSDKSTGEKAADSGQSVANSALGVTGAMRRWAQKLQVDPYTSNTVLRKALEDIGRIDAAGGIAARVAVPIPMVVGATASVGGLVWGKDPEELLKLNETRVSELGTDKKAAEAFRRNKAFTLGYQTRFIAALYAVKVPGCGSYVDTAEEAVNEHEVVFFTVSAEMLERFHKSEPVASILADSRAVVAKSKSGRVVALVAVDYLSWTAESEKAVKELAARAKTDLGAKGVELRLTGRVSDRARQELKAIGWTVLENQT